MTKINNGGPAFPSFNDAGNGATFINYGMSMRDWFAGQALTGVIANPDNLQELTFEEMAKYAYRFADAMLAVRGGGNV